MIANALRLLRSCLFTYLSYNRFTSRVNALRRELFAPSAFYAN